MKKLLLILLVLCSTVLFASSNKEVAVETDELTIYAYDSFTSDWGPGPQIIPLFEEKYGIKVNMVDFGDAGSVLTKAISEKDSPIADIIIGVDNNMLSKALKADILTPYSSDSVKALDKDLQFDKKNSLVPFDYGYFSIIYDTEALDNPPMSLEDLTKPEYAKSLILMDPRTSSPGLGFLLWTKAVYGDDYLEYWNRLKPSILTITDGWSSGYGLFTQGEAPMVLSYTTSPAYHVAYEETTRYQALIFEEGNYMQLEGLGIIKGSKNILNAQKFLDFMLSEEAQNILPMTNWMFPVNSKVELPESFDYALYPKKTLQLDYDLIEKNYDIWLNEWAENSVK
ncbi:MAG: thiamine ABC transporter substrate-binding protein [Spirochaetaceae bacterium]